MTRSMYLATTTLLGLGAWLIAPAAESDAIEATGFPTFTSVPQPPTGLGVDTAAGRAWAIYRFLAARQIAADHLPPSGMINVDAVIVIEHSRFTEVRFVGTERGQPVSYFEVTIQRDDSPEILVTELDPAAPLSDNELSQYMAQTYWLGVLEDLDVCQGYYQQIAVPTKEGGWASYLLPASAPGGQLQTGGAFRKDFSPNEDLSSVAVRLTPGCGGWDIPNEAAAFVMATPKKRLPNEIDVLMSIYFDVPIFMSNIDDDTTWAIEETGFWDVTEMLRE